MGDNIFDFFTNPEQENLESVFLPNCFSAAASTLPKDICKITKTHIKYTVTETKLDEKSFVSDGPFKTDDFGCALFPHFTVEKVSRIIFYRFDRKKRQNPFLQNLSGSYMV